MGSSGSTELLVHVHQDVVVTGQFLLEFPNFGFRLGVLVVTDLELATATDVITIWEVVEDFSTPRWSVLLLVVNILYALLVYIVVILETVVDVLDVHHMLMDTI